MALFRAVFGHPPEGREEGERLLQLWQGAQTAAEYALAFWTVAASSGRNEPTLCTLFRRGLRKNIQTELACRHDNLSLDALIAMAVWITFFKRAGAHLTTPPSFGCPEAEPELMEVGATLLSGVTGDIQGSVPIVARRGFSGVLCITT
jgi:hypothetical protein